MKVTGDDGEVTWESRGRVFATRSADGGEIRYWNQETMEYASYQSRRHAIVLSTVEPWPPSLHYVNQSLEDLVRFAERHGNTLDGLYTRQERRCEGRRLVEFTARNPEDACYSRLVVDAESQRVLETEYERTKTTYEYPERVPADIYEAGAPRDARVVDGRACPSLLKLREGVIAARSKPLGPYRAAIASGIGGMGLGRVITDGVRVRIEFVTGGETALSSVETLRAAASRHVSFPTLRDGERLTSLAISDGRFFTSCGFDNNGEPIGKRVEHADIAICGMHTLDGTTWQRQFPGAFHVWWDRQDEPLGPDALGRIAVRARGQANNCSRPWLQEQWFDPLHGFRPCGGLSANFPSADWQLDPNWHRPYQESPSGVVKSSADAPAQASRWATMEWAELRPGLWYSALRRYEELVAGPDGSWQPRVRSNASGWQPESYDVIVAEPLDFVDDHWFQIPPEVANMPIVGG